MVTAVATTWPIASRRQYRVVVFLPSSCGYASEIPPGAQLRNGDHPGVRCSLKKLRAALGEKGGGGVGVEPHNVMLLPGLFVAGDIPLQQASAGRDTVNNAINNDDGLWARADREAARQTHNAATRCKRLGGGQPEKARSKHTPFARVNHGHDDDGVNSGRNGAHQPNDGQHRLAAAGTNHGGAKRPTGGTAAELHKPERSLSSGGTRGYPPHH